MIMCAKCNIQNKYEYLLNIFIYCCFPYLIADRFWPYIVIDSNSHLLFFVFSYLFLPCRRASQTTSGPVVAGHDVQLLVTATTMENQLIKSQFVS